MSARVREAGLTMVEIMVSVLLVGIAAAFVFGIQVRTSQALRDQSAVSEAQQTLRAASDVIVSDLRQAGYLAKTISIANGGVISSASGIAIGNSSTGPDSLRLQYADTASAAHITENGPSHNASETQVDSNSMFKIGDVILAVYTEPGSALYGTGCIVAISGLQNDDRIQHNPGVGNPWNTASNDQCNVLDTVWKNYPYMLMTRVAMRRYRIQPDDQRGRLQVSPSGGLHANDWVDIAVGIVDLQLAMHVYQPNDTTVDEDGDGDTKHDWFSGEDMESILTDDPQNQLLAVSVTLVAKTTKEVTAVSQDKTPDLFEGSDHDHNRVGDRAGTTLPVTDVNSMYYGDVLFRTYTQTVDMRNLGIGN